MPNWCSNTLVLKHEEPAMIDRAVKAFKEGRLLDEFVPVPKDLQIVSGSVGDPDEQKLLEAQQKQNVERHGYKDWYDFCCNEWGTKWDVDCAEAFSKDGAIHTSFDSAWAPPIAFYEKLADLGYTVKAYYFEPGMNFAGIWEDGDDDYYDLSGMDSGDVQQQLPPELDDAFSISESMAEWEEHLAEFHPCCPYCSRKFDKGQFRH